MPRLYVLEFRASQHLRDCDDDTSETQQIHILNGLHSTLYGVSEVQVNNWIYYVLPTPYIKLMIATSTSGPAPSSDRLGAGWLDGYSPTQYSEDHNYRIVPLVYLEIS